MKLYLLSVFSFCALIPLVEWQKPSTAYKVLFWMSTEQSQRGVDMDKKARWIQTESVNRFRPTRQQPSTLLCINSVSFSLRNRKLWTERVFLLLKPTRRFIKLHHGWYWQFMENIFAGSLPILPEMLPLLLFFVVPRSAVYCVDIRCCCFLYCYAMMSVSWHSLEVN